MPGPIVKRAISGIETRGFQQSFFEGSPNRHKTKKRQESQYNPSIETSIIFAISIFVLIILAGIGFIVREYIYTIKERKTKELQKENKSDNYWVEKAQSGSHTEDPEKWRTAVIKDLTHSSVHHYPRNTFSAAIVNEERADVANSENFVTAQAADKYPKKSGTFFESLPDSSTCSTNNTFFRYTGIKGVENTRSKLKFQIADLLLLQPKEELKTETARIESNSATSAKEVKALSFNDHVSNIQPQEFLSAWKAGKSIQELELYLTNQANILVHDKVTKKIMLFKLSVIGSVDRHSMNATIFLPEFNKVIDKIIETGIVFDLMNESSPNIARELMNMILRYIWYHWSFRIKKHKSINEQFKAWKITSPEVQPHHKLFRYLCSLGLGIYEVGRIDIHSLKDFEGKIVSLMKYFVQNSFCTDYMGIIPTLAETIEFTERILSLRSFYNLLSTVIEKHKDCCMNEYLTEDKTFLKPIVQHGFYVKNDPQVSTLANNIHMIIVSKYPQTMAWWKETDGGMNYVSASAKVLGTCISPAQTNTENKTLLKMNKELQETFNDENVREYQPNVPGSFNF